LVLRSLNNFIEVEADGEESEIEEKRKECAEMLEKIGIPKENFCDKIWLCDIATGKISSNNNKILRKKYVSAK